MNTTATALLCMLAITAASMPAQGKESGHASQSTTKPAHRLKTPKPPASTGHGESRKERDQRLLRECRGKPNAGACEGYAN